MRNFSTRNLRGLEGQWIFLASGEFYSQTGILGSDRRLGGFKVIIDNDIELGNFGAWVPDMDDSEFERLV